jgi:hypothetical protein
MPTDKMMLPRDPSTAHNGGASVSDIQSRSLTSR